MHTRLIVPILSFLALACDAASHVAFRQDTSTGDPDGTGTGCPVEPVAVPPPTSGCACNLGDPDTCALGLDCVPYPADSKTGRCFAKLYGANEFGGGYLTDCTENSLPLQAYQPWAPPGQYFGDWYCPKCLTCDFPTPNGLVCQ